MSESPVINDSDEFVPMPTPDRVLEGEAGKRLDPIPFEFTDIRVLAQRILKRAQEQGQQKLEAARTQIAAMEKQAQDKGYNEGFPKGEKEGFAKGEKEGMAAAEKRIQAAITSEKESLQQNAQPVTGILEQLAAIMNENRQQLMAQAEADLLLLALDLAKRLVGHELSVDPEAIRPLAVEAIGLVTDRTGITVRVNPEDHRVMHEIIPELKNIFPDLGPVKIEADQSIDRGGIMAATREAEVDMRLATRLAAFEEAILGYSGDAAIAPWSSIPPEAIEQFKRQNMESQYSLPPREDEQTQPEEPSPFGQPEPPPQQPEMETEAANPLEAPSPETEMNNEQAEQTVIEDRSAPEAEKMPPEGQETGDNG